MSYDSQITRFSVPNMGRFYPYSYNGEYLCENICTNTLYSLGIGMNNSPHLMTVCQLLYILDLQRKGCNVQIVLGDLDVLLARCFIVDLDLIGRYKDFIINLGFAEDTIVRTQSENQETALSVPLISSVVEDSDFDALSEPYDKIYNRQMTYKSKLSFVLMAADFITPILNNKVNNVCMVGGIDEGKYAVWSDVLLQRILHDNKKHVCGLFTEVNVPGLNGHPKMSKSIPESAIFMSDENNVIENKIMSIQSDNMLRMIAASLGLSLSDTEIRSTLINEVINLSNKWNNK